MLRRTLLSSSSARISADFVHSSPFPSVLGFANKSNLLLGDMVSKDWDKFGSKLAIVDAISGDKRTFTEYSHRTSSAASSFASSVGISAGDAVCIFSPNHVDYLPATLGLLRLGAVMSPANPLYTSYELTTQLNKSKSVAILAHPLFKDVALKAARDSATCKKVLLFGGERYESDGHFDGLVEDGASGANNFHKTLAGVSSEQLALLPFSSGTTGLPKGTMLTHRNVAVNMLQFEGPEGQYVSLSDVCISPLPMFHIYGFMASLVCSAYKGNSLVTMRSFDLVKFCELVQHYKPTRAHLVPPIILGLAKHPIVAKYDLKSLKMLVSAAAPLGAEVEDAVRTALPGVQCKQAWGMSELSPVGTATPDGNLKTGSGTIGPVVADTLGKIVCLTTGKNMPPGKENTGELCIKGPQVMKGYLDEPDKTRDCLSDDGWLRTGDVAFADADGYFYIVDRLKELIKYKGFQVAPAELEALICTHSAVQDAVVIPVPDSEAGEIPRAYVVKKEGANISEEDIKAFVAERASPHKKLRGGVIFVKTIPKTASGKILRREVVAMDRKEAKK